MNADKTKTFWISSAFICVHLRLLSCLLAANSASPPPGFTGGFSEPTCVQCHTGSLNPIGGSVVVASPVNYTPGTTYNLRVQVSDASAAAWGFQLSARFSNGSQAGTLAPTSSVAVGTASSGGFAVQYAGQLGAAVTAGQTFTVTVPWTAPASGGLVVFSIVGMASDHDATPAGDRTYLSELRATSGLPLIGANGVVNAASYQPSLAPGQVVSIFGQNLTAAAPTSATSFPLPTVIGPTKVLFSGMEMPLIYVSSTQINAQIPAEYDPGSAVLVVQVNLSTSLNYPVTLAASAPGIFTANSMGLGPGAILHADYGPVNASRPANGGETVLIFATGLGPVTPHQVSGQAAPANSQTVFPVTVSLGGTPAIVSFSGLAPGFAGLYQINAIVPGGLSGIVDIRVTAGAVTSPGGVTIQLQ